MEEKFNWIDADSILVSACMAAQYNYMVYLDDVATGPTKSKKQWKIDNPDLNDEDYEFRLEATLKNDSNLPPIQICKNIIACQIRDIEKKYPDYIAWVCIEGEGNFRKDLYPDYKGNRKGEIILRKEMSRWVIDTFPRVKVSFGIETDDTVAKWQWKGYQDFLRTGIYTHMVSSPDKDAKTVAGKIYNYGKDEEYLIDELEADRWFCTQLLYGDSVDNIKGINAPISVEILKELEVRVNRKGVGEKTARGIMAHPTTSRECFEMVVRCYKDVHGHPWLSYLQEEAIALRMQHVEDEIYSILDHMIALEVDLNE